MTLPGSDVIAAVLMAVLAGATLLAVLIAANRLLGGIARRLSDLSRELDSICAATEPLTGRVGAVAVNVANLKEAAVGFNGILAERVQASRPHSADEGVR